MVSAVFRLAAGSPAPFLPACAAASAVPGTGRGVACARAPKRGTSVTPEASSSPRSSRSTAIVSGCGWPMPTAVPWTRAVSMSLRTWRRMASAFTSASRKMSRSRAGTPAARATSTPRVAAVVRLSSQNRPCSLSSAISGAEAGGVLGESRSHVIVHADGARDRGEARAHLGAQGLRGHRGQQDALAGVLPPFLARFHRLVQEHLDAAPGGLAHRAGRGRQPGDDGDRERDVQLRPAARSGRGSGRGRR